MDRPVNRKPAGCVKWSLGMRTEKIPYYEFSKGIFEIDEFDCASIFVIVGEERALVLDTGTGIGDLRRVIENRITAKPYDVVLTHNHVDHAGGAGFLTVSGCMRRTEIGTGRFFRRRLRRAGSMRGSYQAGEIKIIVLRLMRILFSGTGNRR